jgi:L-cysteine:1D-myo-inositol 2-amino-2-deoxy-alpha-D-glucopyranoside ligase
VLTGVAPFARHYVHAGMIGLDGEKMSKSRGNLVFVSRLRGDHVDPMAVRLALLDGHYRADREWTGGRLPAAEARLARWRAAAARPSGPAADGVLAQVRAALSDDLDTATALTALDAWVDGALAAPVEQGDRSGPELFSRLVDALLGVAL